MYNSYNSNQFTNLPALSQNNNPAMTNAKNMPYFPAYFQNDNTFFDIVYESQVYLSKSWRVGVTIDEIYNDIFNNCSQIQMRYVDVPADLQCAVQYLLHDTTHNFTGILIQILTCISIATCGKVTIHCNDTWQESTPLWTVQSNESGTRKSACAAILRKPFDSFMQEKNKEVELIKISQEFYETTKKELKNSMRREIKKVLRSNEFSYENHAVIEAIKAQYTNRLLSLKHASCDEEIRQEVNFFLESGTPLGLCELLQTQGESCGCITAEDTLLIKLFIDTGCDPMLLNKLYGQEPHSHKTKREKFTLQQPAFSIVNFVQPTTLKRLLFDKKLQDLGVVARILPYMHSSSNHTDRYFEPINASIEAYNNTITRLLKQFYTQKIDKPRHTVRLSAEAYAEVKAYEQYLKHETHNENAGSAYRKLHGQAVRLAWAFHAWNNEEPCSSEISLSEMQMAISICDEIKPMFNAMYSSDNLTLMADAKKVFNILINIYTKHGWRRSEQYIPFIVILGLTELTKKRLISALYFLSHHNALRVINQGSIIDAIVVHPTIRYPKSY